MAYCSLFFNPMIIRTKRKQRLQFSKKYNILKDLYDSVLVKSFQNSINAFGKPYVVSNPIPEVLCSLQNNDSITIIKDITTDCAVIFFVKQIILVNLNTINSNNSNETIDSV